MPLLLPVRMSLAVGAALALAGCGGGNEQTGETVKMKDLEVTDGTVNDGMTDLDGVQAEGTALVDMGSNAASGVGNSSSAAAPASTATEPEAGAEVVAEQ